MNICNSNSLKCQLSNKIPDKVTPVKSLCQSFFEKYSCTFFPRRKKSPKRCNILSLFYQPDTFYRINQALPVKTGHNDHCRQKQIGHLPGGVKSLILCIILFMSLIRSRLDISDLLSTKRERLLKESFNHKAYREREKSILP